MTINTQNNSFRGWEGFAIAIEQLKADFGEAIITIFVSSFLQMDVSVYLLRFLSTIHYARQQQRFSKSRPEADARWIEIRQSMRAESLGSYPVVGFFFFFSPPLCASPANSTAQQGPTKTTTNRGALINCSDIEQPRKAAEPQSERRLTLGSERNCCTLLQHGSTHAWFQQTEAASRCFFFL